VCVAREAPRLAIDDTNRTRCERVGLSNGGGGGPVNVLLSRVRACVRETGVGLVEREERRKYENRTAAAAAAVELSFADPNARNIVFVTRRDDVVLRFVRVKPVATRVVCDDRSFVRTWRTRFDRFSLKTIHAR